MTNDRFAALRKRARKGDDADPITVTRGTIRALLDAADERDSWGKELAEAQNRIQTDEKIISSLLAERDRLVAALRDVEYGLAQAKVWGGMDWEYVPLHPIHYRPLLEKVGAALAEYALERKAENARDLGLDY